MIAPLSPGLLLTRRWREPDPNHRSPRMPTPVSKLTFSPLRHSHSAEENRRIFARGTDGSNPVPSSRQSVSVRISPPFLGKPGFSAGVRPTPTWSVLLRRSSERRNAPVKPIGRIARSRVPIMLSGNLRSIACNDRDRGLRRRLGPELAPDPRQQAEREGYPCTPPAYRKNFLLPRAGSRKTASRRVLRPRRAAGGGCGVPRRPLVAAGFSAAPRDAANNSRHPYPDEQPSGQRVTSQLIRRANN